MFFQHKLMAMACLCFIPLIHGCSSTAHSDKASIACSASDEHPICKATYKLNPSGTLGSSGESSGIAIVNGNKVEFICRAGNASARQPRNCSW